jgi:phosphonate transport system substrate-binding protein
MMSSSTPAWANHWRPGGVRIAVLLSALLSSLLIACAVPTGSGTQRTLFITGIPDQDVSVLEKTFKGMAAYLTEKTGLQVEFIPSADYAAVVTAFKNGDVQLGWYGGLTGVQARLAVKDADAIAQRTRDEAFHTVFVANPNSGIKSLADVRGKSLTFGSESSTSGHLMARFYLLEAGVDPSKDVKGTANFSGSHDTTWKLVESGAFDVGALNEAVWEQREKAGEIDKSKVAVFHRTPAYYDYHWVIRPDVDQRFGAGTRQKLTQAILDMNASNPKEKEVLDLFATDKFIPTRNENYQAIERVARNLRIVE